MSAREWEQAKPAHRERRMPIMNEVHDIMRLRENQAAAKQTFGFQGSLTSKYPAKQDGEHEVRICEMTVEIKNSSKERWHEFMIQ